MNAAPLASFQVVIPSYTVALPPVVCWYSACERASSRARGEVRSNGYKKGKSTGKIKIEEWDLTRAVL